MIVSVYPLDNGSECRILPGILRDSYGGVSEQDYLTVTKEDGTVLEGTCVGYHPAGDETYFDWNFGPAEPGKYTLHIPYVIREGVCTDSQIPVNLENNTWEDLDYNIPGGTISVESCVPVDVEPILPPPIISPEPDVVLLQCPYVTGNRIRLQVNCMEENCSLFNIFMSGLSDQIEVDPEKQHECALGANNDTDMEALDTEQGIVEYLVKIDPFTTAKTSFRFELHKAKVNYKWNQPFDISFTVE